MSLLDTLKSQVNEGKEKAKNYIEKSDLLKEKKDKALNMLSNSDGIINKGQDLVEKAVKETKNFIASQQNKK